MQFTAVHNIIFPNKVIFPNNSQKPTRKKFVANSLRIFHKSCSPCFALSRGTQHKRRTNLLHNQATYQQISVKISCYLPRYLLAHLLYLAAVVYKRPDHPVHVVDMTYLNKTDINTGTNVKAIDVANVWKKSF